MRLLGRNLSLIFFVFAVSAQGEVLPSPHPLPAPAASAVATNEPALSPLPIDTRPQRNSDCRWNECAWLPYTIEPARAEAKSLSGGCLARAKAVAELDLTHYAAVLPETRDWVLTQPAQLAEDVLRARDQNSCPSWAAGMETLAKWDEAVRGACAAASPGGLPTADSVSPCLTSVILFRSATAAFLHADETPDLISDSQTAEALFHAELYSGAPSLERLGALLDRFLTILPGDVGAMTRLSSVYFAQWATKPDAIRKANVARTVARLELYTQSLEDLFPAEVMRALAENNALTLRRWALKVAEKQSGVDSAIYFMAWSAWMERDYKQSQVYLRQVLRNDDVSWDLEAHAGLKRLLARAPEVAQRMPFFPPSVQLKLTFAVPEAGFAKGVKAFAPGDSLKLIGPEAIPLYTNEAHAPSALPEIKEAVAEVQSGARTVRTELEEFLHASALTALRSGQLTVAAAAIRDLIGINPENEGGVNLSQAIDLQALLKANPQDADSAMKLAQVWYQEKQYDLAAEQMRKLLVLRPKNQKVQRSLTNFQDLHDWEERLQAEVKANSQSEHAWYRYACFLAREQRWEDAQTALDHAAAINPAFSHAEAMRRKIQLWIQLPDRTQRTSDVYSFLTTEVQDPQLNFPRALVAEILRR